MKKKHILLLLSLVSGAILSIPANYSLAILLNLRTPQIINSLIPAPIINIFWYLTVITWTSFWLIIGVKIGKSQQIILVIILGILVSLVLPVAAINLIGILSAYSAPSYLGEQSLLDKTFRFLAIKYGGFLGKTLLCFLGSASFLIVGTIFSFFQQKYQATGLNQKQSLKLSLLTTILGIGSSALIINVMPQFLIPVWLISGIYLLIIIRQ